MISRSKTLIATPPGYAIREQLEHRKMTQKEFALRMDMSEKHISHLINGEVRLTPNTAMRLEAVLGLPASFWNNLEARYQDKLLKIEEENAIDADIEIAKCIPFSEMAKLGWIVTTKKVIDKVRELRKYFGVSRLGVLDKLITQGVAYRRTSSNEKTDYILAAWVQRARILARDIEVSPINLQELSSIIPDIRAMTTEPPEEFSLKLPRILGDCGIAVIFLPHLKGSFLHGASFLEGKKIVLALTVRGHDADKFWFSFFHEISHILEGDINQRRPLTEEEERRANKYAQDILIPPKEYADFTSKKDYTASSVKKFASKLGVDAGIVVGRLQNEAEIGFDRLNELKKHYELI